ncbi:hypothetical protein [Rugamonas apoptosis]|uniref:Uncharacterized protein n=1 Tax=Rugamonas apoptosis TaxID=2758570 RepID=A0A7W2F7T0_9BURK|nr:hypothetical protein [Rugamonas apoptosis]MBA5686707.1 hypothetical protein [Rugamonas apoptosis]
MTTTSLVLSSTVHSDSSFLTQIAQGRQLLAEAQAKTNAIADFCEREWQQIEAGITHPHAGFDLLEEAPMTLFAKDRVMRDLPIVPVPICAAFLGLKPNDIFSFKRKNQSMGAIYQQSLCFSINQLEVLANNRDWFVDEYGHKYTKLNQIPSTDFLLHGTFVDFEVVWGYLSFEGQTSFDGLTVNAGCRRPYRLADVRNEFCKQLKARSAKQLAAALTPIGATH